MKIKIAHACRRTAVIGLSVVTYFGYGLLSAALTLPGQAAASQTTATFKTNILQSACNISFLDDSNAPLTGTYSLGEINSAEINQIYPKGKLFTIKLSDCGVAAGTKTPQVTITGINAIKSQLSSTHANEYKFRGDALDGGTSQEYFVVIGEGPTLTYNGLNSNKNGLYSTKAPNNVVLKGTKGTSGDGVTAKLYASVACDDACSSKKKRAGNLKARLTFQFDYQ